MPGVWLPRVWQLPLGHALGTVSQLLSVSQSLSENEFLGQILSPESITKAAFISCLHTNGDFHVSTRFLEPLKIFICSEN